MAQNGAGVDGMVANSKSPVWWVLVGLDAESQIITGRLQIATKSRRASADGAESCDVITSLLGGVDAYKLGIGADISEHLKLLRYSLTGLRIGDPVPVLVRMPTHTLYMYRHAHIGVIQPAYKERQFAYCTLYKTQ